MRTGSSEGSRMFQSVQMRKGAGRRLLEAFLTITGAFGLPVRLLPQHQQLHMFQQPAGGDTSFLPSCGRMKCQSVTTKLTGSDCSAAALSGTF